MEVEGVQKDARKGQLRVICYTYIYRFGHVMLYLPIGLPINNSYELHGFFIARLAKSNHPSPTALPFCCHAQFESCQAMDSAGRAGALVCEGSKTINRCWKLVLSTCSWLFSGVPILYPVLVRMSLAASWLATTWLATTIVLHWWWHVMTFDYGSPLHHQPLQPHK